MNDRLSAFASTRQGVFTSADARRLDVPASALRRMALSGDVVHLRRDAYVLGSRWFAANDDVRYALRARSILAGRRLDAASHHAALAMHRLPIWGVSRTIVDIVADCNRMRVTSGVRFHPRPDHVADAVADGCRCMPIGVAIAQVAMTSGPVAGVVPLDAALHAGRCSLDDLSAAAESLTTTGSQRTRLDRAISLADLRSESVGETRTRLVLSDLGWTPESQVTIRNGVGEFVARVDFLLQGRVVIEFDGLAKYSSADGHAALVAEKRREDALRALGYVVVRVTWSDLDDPTKLARAVRRALAQAAA